jgi:hypothetical protein
MQHLGVPVIAEGVSLPSSMLPLYSIILCLLKDRKKKRPQRKERNEDTYSVSRWVPVVKDIMEASLMLHVVQEVLHGLNNCMQDAISGTLDSKLYPFAPGTASTQSAERGPGE